MDQNCGLYPWSKVLLPALFELPPVAQASLSSYLLLAWSSTLLKKQKISTTSIHGKLDLELEKVETESMITIIQRGRILYAHVR